MHIRHQERMTICWSNAMFGGKTEEAGIRVATASHAGRRWALIRPKRSERSGESDNDLVTHGGRQYPAYSVENAIQAKDVAIALIADGVDTIWIDEPFLFPDKENICETIFTILERAEVIISTLSRTSEGDWWPEIGELLSKADHIVDCRRAVCWWCKGEASRTVCIKQKDGKNKVGGAETYRAACIGCWNRETAHGEH